MYLSSSPTAASQSSVPRDTVSRLHSPNCAAVSRPASASPLARPRAWTPTLKAALIITPRATRTRRLRPGGPAKRSVGDDSAATGSGDDGTSGVDTRSS
jgi:hypothetical protein